MRTLLPVLLMCTSCASFADYAPGGGDLYEQVNLNLGQRIFHHASANCLDEQDSAALEYSVWREDGLIGYDIGLGYHRDHGVLPVVGSTNVEGFEGYLGLRRTLPIEGSPITPYVGLGLTGWWADRDETIKSDRDGTEIGLGVYERIGASVMISERAFVGLDLRFVQEEFLHNGDLNMDGHVLALVLGVSL